VVLGKGKMDYASNKKAYANYTIRDKFEVGVGLLGTEVKSVRKGMVSLSGAFVVMRGEEAYLMGATISPYQPNNMPSSYKKDRPRKLLLHKKELMELAQALQQRGLTVLPLRMYNKGAKIKLEIAIAQGKRKYEKREAIKKRDVRRDIDRSLKRG